MKLLTSITSSAILLLSQTFSYSGSMPESVARDSMINAAPLESVSVGLNFDKISRGINHDSNKLGKLEANAYSAFMGYDVCKWSTLFLTIGRSEARFPGQSKFGDAQTKWSMGVNASLWNTEATRPRFIEGQISLRTILEYSQYSSTENSSNTKWSDSSGALFLAYERTIEDPMYSPIDIYSFAIYFGPMFSVVDGSASNTDNGEFKQNRNLGLLAGLDLFFFKNLSFGCQLQLFEEASIGGNFRYHF